MVGKDVDQRAFELLRIGMAEFGRREFLKMLVQQPGVVERRLQDQRFAARDRGAVAAMQRACGKLRARRDIGSVTAKHRHRAGSAAAPRAGLEVSLLEALVEIWVEALAK